MNSNPDRIRKRLTPDLLHRMASRVSDEDRDEMAIPSYLHRNPLMRWMAWRRLEAIAGLVRESVAAKGDTGFTRVMDFGCGTGVLLDELARVADEVTGVDLVLDAAQLLVEEWQLDRIRLMTPETARTAFPANYFDAIVAAEVLEHIEPLDETLAFFRSRLKPGGRLFVSVPTENALYRLGRGLAGFDGHYHESDAAAIHQQILAGGFRQTRLTKIPAPGPLAIYWVAVYQPT